MIWLAVAVLTVACVFLDRRHARRVARLAARRRPIVLPGSGRR